MAAVFPAAHIRLLITLGRSALFLYARKQRPEGSRPAALQHVHSGFQQMSPDVRTLSAGQPNRRREQERPANGTFFTVLAVAVFMCKMMMISDAF